MSKIVFIGEARAALAPVGPHWPAACLRLQTNLRISGSALSTNQFDPPQTCGSRAEDYLQTTLHNARDRAARSRRVRVT